MKKRKFLSLFLTTVLAISLFAGCKSKSGDSPVQENPSAETTEKTESTDASAPEASDDSGASFSLLQFHKTTDESGTGAAYRIASEAWKEVNPGVTIEEEFVAHDDYETYLKTMMASNTLPDVFICKGDMLEQLAGAGVIVPLDDDIAGEWGNGFSDGALTDGTVDDKVYTIPFQLQANCTVVYNQDILTECGVNEFPSTYDELLDAIDKINAKGYTPIALGNSAKWVAESCLFNTFAYRYVTADWFLSLKNGQGAKFTDEAFVKALADFQNLANVGAFNSDMNSIDNMQQKTMYYNKKAAMFIEGAWCVGDIIANAPEDVKAVTQFANLPEVTGAGGDKDAVAGGAGWGYCINASLTGENKEAALSFLKAVSDSNYGEIALQNGFISGSKVENIDTSSLDPIFAKYLAYVSTVKQQPIFDVQLPAAVSEELYARTQELLIGAVTPEEMAQYCQEVLDAQ